MLYFKITDGDTIVSAEAHENPVWVCRQTNGIIVRCYKRDAQGILSLDSSVAYQLEGKTSLGIDALTATEIAMTEYEEIINGLEPVDSEDESPEVPEGTSEEDVLTRAELTEKVAMLEECILEMSSVIYA